MYHLKFRRMRLLSPAPGRCSLILSSDKLELYASYARIHKAIPESQSKVVAANEKKMNTYLPTLQQPATGF
jgi:hypothetical protein